MKIRQGFVSNSSSSSFIIATRDNLSETDLKEKINKDVFGDCKKGSTFYNLANEIAAVMVNKISEEITDIEDFGSNEKEYNALKAKLPHIFMGFANSDCCDAAESILCDLEIMYEDNELYIRKEAGY
jgi:hypothetical protein